MTFEASYQIWRKNRSQYGVVRADTPEEKAHFLAKVCNGDPQYAIDNYHLWDFGRR